MYIFTTPGSKNIACTYVRMYLLTPLSLSLSLSLTPPSLYQPKRTAGSLGEKSECLI